MLSTEAPKPVLPEPASERAAVEATATPANARGVVAATASLVAVGAVVYAVAWFRSDSGGVVEHQRAFVAENCPSIQWHDSQATTLLHDCYAILEAKRLDAGATQADRPAQPAPAHEYKLTATLAFAEFRGSMIDAYGEDSKGAEQFASWGALNMEWSDVFVAPDETTFARVQKDPSEERGLRMCSSGDIIEIHAGRTMTGGQIARGLLNSDAGHLYRFIAVKSSGDLGERSRATLCGFVVGTYDYPNSGGGTGHAVAVVGMFDLPENRRSARKIDSVDPTPNPASAKISTCCAAMHRLAGTLGTDPDALRLTAMTRQCNDIAATADINKARDLVTSVSIHMPNECQF